MNARPIRDLLLLAALGACSETTTSTTPPPRDAAPVDAPPADVAADEAPVEDVTPDKDVAPPEDVPPPSSGIGEPCTTDQQFGQGTCASRQICLSDRIGFRNGYCVQACLGTAACPADAICTQLQGYPVCLRRCTTAADCRTGDGYVCAATGRPNQRVCNVNDAPVGTRDGEACFTTMAGDHQIPALPRRTFTGSNLTVSGARADSALEAEGNIAASPTGDRVINSYIAIGNGGDSFMGVTYGPTAGATAPPWEGYGQVRDPLGGASDPVLDWGADNVIRMTYIGLARSGSGQVSRSTIRYAESTNGGMTWSTPAAVEPTNFCNQGGICDKPWILSGPGATAGSRWLYIAYLRQTSAAADMTIQRSEDNGRTWSAPYTFARAAMLGEVLLVPNLVQIDTGPGGAVGAAWVALAQGMASGADGAARFGSPDSRIYFRRSADGFRTPETLRLASRTTDSPVYTQPPMAMDGATVHVAYLTGNATGAWDVILATSVDNGMTWRHRKVNDEPDSCATHMLPAMVVDHTTHDVHMIFLDNRFGDGEVAYARCPADPATPCGANERVSDEAGSFAFTTGRNPMSWHGDYLGLTLASNGDLWAGWSDTRNGRPAMYAARGRAR